MRTNRVITAIATLLALSAGLAGCSWFHRKQPPAPPPELVVTGAPAGSTLMLDGTPIPAAAVATGRYRVLTVTPGSHTLEVKSGNAVTYREQVDVGAGERRVITVLSGDNRY